jgi:hypothetical protein
MRRNWPREGRQPVRDANSDSPSEPSLANSGAIRSDGRKNPSVGFLPREGRKNPSAYYALASLPEGGVSDPLTGTPLRGESGPTTRRSSSTAPLLLKRRGAVL